MEFHLLRKRRDTFFCIQNVYKLFINQSIKKNSAYFRKGSIVFFLIFKTFEKIHKCVNNNEKSSVKRL